jgi:receptor protein-tyrosine kinase
MADEPTGRPTPPQRRSSVERFADRLGQGSSDPLLNDDALAPRQAPPPAPPPSAAPAPPVVAAAPSSAPTQAATAAPMAPPSEHGAPVRAPAKANGGGDGNAESYARRTRNRVKLDMEGLRAAGVVTSYTDRSHIAEEFRLIKRPLLLKAFAPPPDDIVNGNLIMVTSSKAGEGKTFCAVSLAMSIAQERDLTVLLIDADVAKPDIPRVLGIETQKGLVDLIADENDSLDLADVLVRTDLENLTILPAGRQHHLATELLASEKMDKFVKDIAARYPDRVIIFDSPPVLMSSVPGVLALHVGQILFVVEADRTVQPSVDTALGLISTCQDISLLLNKTQPSGNNGRFGAYYGYGYGADR